MLVAHFFELGGYILNPSHEPCVGYLKPSLKLSIKLQVDMSPKTSPAYHASFQSKKVYPKFAKCRVEGGRQPLQAKEIIHDLNLSVRPSRTQRINCSPQI